MTNYRAHPFWGLAVGAFFGLVAGVCVCAAFKGVHSELDTVGTIFYFVLGGAMAGLSLGSKFNPMVSRYWPWLVVTFGIGLVPTFDIMMEDYYRTPRGLRDDSFVEYVPFLLCALIATTVAMIAAIIHHAKHLIRGEKDDVSNFSLATILLVLGGVSVAFGLLRWIDAPVVFFYIVVIFILGRFACLFINAILSKRNKTLSHPATSPKNEQTVDTLKKNMLE
jgi:hypothetical protein